MMSALDIVQTFITAAQSGDSDMAAQLLTDDFTLQGFIERPLTQGEFLALQSLLFDAMPDMNYNLSNEQEVQEGVQALMQLTGTNTADLSLPMFGLQNVAATGNTVMLPQVPVLFRITDGRISSMEMAMVPGGGLSGLVQQIGAELPVWPVEKQISQ